MLQTSPTQKIFIGYNAPTRNEAYRNSRTLSTSATMTTLRNSEKQLDCSIVTTTPKDSALRLTARNNCTPIEEVEAQYKWPEIESIVRKIKAIQLKLKEEQRVAKDLDSKVKVYEVRVFQAEQQHKIQTAKIQNYTRLESRVKQLQNVLLEKEKLLAQKQQMIQQLQYRQIRKNADTEEKIKNLSLQNRDFIQKLKMAKNQVQRQRKNFKELRDSMTNQVEHMKSQKQQLLQEELEKLKQAIFHTKEEAESVLYKQIDVLNRRIYLQQQDIQKKNIEFSLLERKKQQAINETIEKKDQEIKIQKSLFKSLNERMAKLQEEIKSKKTSSPDIYRTNRHKMTRSLIMDSVHQEQVTLQLSPDKA